MRVLIISQHFAPEITAARARVQAFAEGLARRGHEVEVVCAVPNHPAGVIEPEFRGRLIASSPMDGFQVRRVWVRASPRKSAINRVLLYGTFAAMATVAGSTVVRRPDVVLASSPPLPVGVAAAAVAARHRVPWVFDVRDLWPEAAIALGELREGRLARAVARLERRLYRSADRVVTVTEPFGAEISAVVDEPSKVRVIMNGTTSLWVEAGEREPDRAALDLPRDRFIWAYAGNLGLAQGLDTAISAAAELGEAYQLLVLGDGPMRQSLERQAAELPPGTVAFRGLVEPETAAAYLRAADALLVPLDAQPALRKYVPSKLFDCLAIGRPVIVAAAGESERLVTAANAGVTVPPRDSAGIAGAVRRLRGDAMLGARLADAGRAFAADHLRERQADRLEEVLREAAG